VNIRINIDGRNANVKITIARDEERQNEKKCVENEY